MLSSLPMEKKLKARIVIETSLHNIAFPVLKAEEKFHIKNYHTTPEPYTTLQPDTTLQPGTTLEPDTNWSWDTTPKPDYTTIPEFYTSEDPTWY